MNTHRLPTIEAADGHRFELLAQIPSQPTSALLWLPALGVAARHYQPFAEALAARGVAVFLHEWRGHGSSSLRAGSTANWGYRELLEYDLPAAERAMRETLPYLPLQLGGHSLGGQLACCHAGLQPAAWQAVWLVASGTPWWRSFPAPRRYLLPLVYRFLPWLAQHKGALPGRKLGFGGTEARGLIHDWARVGLSNHYAAAGLPLDLEAAINALAVPVQALVLDADWLAPASSMQALLDKMPLAQKQLRILSAHELGVRADHFSWMKTPDAVATLLCPRDAGEISQKR